MYLIFISSKKSFISFRYLYSNLAERTLYLNLFVKISTPKSSISNCFSHLPRLDMYVLSMKCLDNSGFLLVKLFIIRFISGFLFPYFSAISLLFVKTFLSPPINLFSKQKRLFQKQSPNNSVLIFNITIYIEIQHIIFFLLSNENIYILIFMI